MREVNFDGIVGPTHNYGGLSYGNVASLEFAKNESSPKQAALQGLKKAKYLADMGIPQALLAPQVRPDFSALRNLGFYGSDKEILAQAADKNPLLLSLCYSSSFMWTANAATVSPSCDTADKKLHLSVANLRAKPHRAIEPESTYQLLKKVFPDETKFQIHPCLELGDAFSDEGAANHTRFENPQTKEGLHFFVYGREATNAQAPQPKKFPARQTLEASQAIARRHGIAPDQVYFAQQNPNVIDAGVFHNDVISVGYENVFLYHEDAFINTEQVIFDLQERLAGNLVPILVSNEEVSIAAAVKSYLFNSQIVGLKNNEMALIAPENCREDKSVKEFIDKMIHADSNPITQVHYFDLQQSMKNGGGPACLRLRVAMTEGEIASLNASCILTDSKYEEMVAWVNHYYRDKLSTKDLADYNFVLEVREAMQALNAILNL